MFHVQSTIHVPLRTDDDGVLYVLGTRVTLEAVIVDFKRGATPEAIVEHFSVLKLPDVYHIIGYYLENQAEVDAYLEEQHRTATMDRMEWERAFPQKRRTEWQARFGIRESSP